MKFELHSKETGEFFLTRDQLDLTGATYDTALPQPWCNDVQNKLGDDYYPAYQFVMLYWGSSIYGRAYPVTDKGIEIYDMLKRRYPDTVA